MNKLMNHSNGIVAVTVLVFIAMLWFCFTIDGMMENIVNKASHFTTFLSAVMAGYSGYGLSRLNVFDKLEELQERDATLIYNQVCLIRERLESIIPFCLICGFIILISALIATNNPHEQFLININLHVFIGIFFSFAVAMALFLLILMDGIFKRIKMLRDRVILLSQTEKNRKALLSKMYEQAEKYPLSEMDFHFKKHKTTINP